ncbi:MAG: hypothetical protein WBG16_18410 [Bradyrhizobium sp.]|uniref:hypothetical protein n=1 Tax=Bradyrhizobium sp. TaxID=376 RepID=UPI003C759227
MPSHSSLCRADRIGHFRSACPERPGYARVSPGGKSESVDAQARQLAKAGCKKVFRDVHVNWTGR